MVHGFFDNYSHFITGIRASNSNSTESVSSVFLEAISKHGLPSRVCGDHGVENFSVADYMESVRGRDRGSYIWGRFVSSLLVVKNFILTRHLQEDSQLPTRTFLDPIYEERWI